MPNAAMSGSETYGGYFRCASSSKKKKFCHMEMFFGTEEAKVEEGGSKFDESGFSIRCLKK